jgi:hypothetical protein
MKRRVAEVALWIATLVSCGWGYTRWVRAVPEPDAPPSLRVLDVAEPRVSPRRKPAGMIERTVSANPFRLDRSAAPIRYAAVADPAAPPPPPPPPAAPRPQLSVSGVVGPPWAAILEGVPGRASGVVVRPGDLVGELRVRAVSPSAVVIQGPDTTWRLTVHTP